jgi:fatty acid desaturase
MTFERVYLLLLGAIIAGTPIYRYWCDIDASLWTTGDKTPAGFAILAGLTIIATGLIISQDTVEALGNVLSPSPVFLLLFIIAFPIYWLVHTFTEADNTGLEKGNPKSSPRFRSTINPKKINR